MVLPIHLSHWKRKNKGTALWDIAFPAMRSSCILQVLANILHCKRSYGIPCIKKSCISCAQCRNSMNAEIV